MGYGTYIRQQFNSLILALARIFVCVEIHMNNLVKRTKCDPKKFNLLGFTWFKNCFYNATFLVSFLIFDNV